jgi:hypothetical protein
MQAFSAQDRQRNTMDVLRGEDQTQAVTRRVGDNMLQTSQNQIQNNRREFSNEEALIRRSFNRHDEKHTEDTQHALVRNLARRDRKLSRSLNARQIKVQEAAKLQSLFAKATDGRRKLRHHVRQNTGSIIDYIRNMARRQRQIQRAAERRRDAKERHRRMESLTRRSEANLVKTQNNFLKNVSGKMRSWTKTQRRMNEDHARDFGRFHTKLNKKIRKLENELADRE